jgi:transposase InsO family protein
MCESFFATLECELLGRRRFRNQIEARMATFDFLESWYNLQRRHSALEWCSADRRDEGRRDAIYVPDTSPNAALAAFNHCNYLISLEPTIGIEPMNC